MLSFKINIYILVFFLGASLANCMVFFGDNSLSSFLAGELIIIFFAYDLAKTEYKFHIYQILLCYFYYSLCLTHSFSGFFLKSDYYSLAYIICLTHFIFLAIGYNSIKYKNGTLVFYPKQNLIVLIYLLVSIATLLSQINFEGSGKGYADAFRTPAEEARANINIFSYVYHGIESYIKTFALLIFSNPFVYGFWRLFHGLASYIGSGVKAMVVVPFLTLLMIFQIYYKKIKTKHFLILFPIGFVFLILLIGTTAFRGDLSLKSFMRLNLHTILQTAQSFMGGAESSHIIYTSDIIKRIDMGETTYRYGFDFYRFILYPFKGLIDNFGYASYVEYYALRSGKLSTAGQYIGLAGELYWNFGVFFFIFSFLMGYALKRFTNYAFSLKPFGVITYLLLIHLVTWRYYRGAVSDIMFIGSIYLISSIIFFGLMRLLGVKFPRLGRKLVKRKFQLKVIAK